MDLQALGSLALVAPFLAIFAVFAHYHLRRAIWKRKRRLGKSLPGFCPSTFALGTALQLMPTFYRPSMDFAIKARLVEVVEEDDEGDPEKPAKHLHRQLRRIRRGEPVDTLVVKL
ncbi:MAG: hypothetical protein WB608_10640 [Terracidiphilus sp.]